MNRTLIVQSRGVITETAESGNRQGQSGDYEQLQPEVIYYLNRLQREHGFQLILVDAAPMPASFITLLQKQGLDIKAHFSFEELQKSWHTARGQLLTEAFALDAREARLITNNSYWQQWSEQIGMPVCVFKSLAAQTNEVNEYNWRNVYEGLVKSHRSAEITRTTSETDIRLHIQLDGEGLFSAQSGIGFFDHMLALLAKHSGMDIWGELKGDLHVDEHHLVEDTAIVLGEGILKALGDKKGISRYGFVLPMDEALATVALDFSGRSYLVWKAEFNRERIGDMPTELFEHFFKSLSDHAKCTIHIHADGKNEHHKIEAIFKAFGRSLKMAWTKETGSFTIPSSKGVL